MVLTLLCRQRIFWNKYDMIDFITYGLIFASLFVLELVYFRIADRYNIIDKPNERSSHKRIVLRGGGIIFLIGVWLWSLVFGFHYPWMLVGVTLAAGVSFVDDIHLLPVSVRLVTQFLAMLLVFVDAGFFSAESLGLNVESQWMQVGWMASVIVVALIVCVGATNIYNFMDGINGITGGYSLAVLIPLLLLNRRLGFVEESYLLVVGLSLLVFCFFNFRTKAKCFAGDVGSIGIALLLLFAIGRLFVQTGDVTWLVLLLVYGVDGCLTIIHRMMLHENLGQAHRKHAFQLMANELKMKHTTVSMIYMLTQLCISLIAIFVIPDTAAAHWGYFLGMIIIACMGYVLFMKKYYHLHEDYLKRIGK